MSYYYKYNFTSPEPVYAIVKEELKSYFDTGAIDDLLFPTYVHKCLNKLGRASYKIGEVALIVEDFQATLPDNFYAVREAWMCAEIALRPYLSANSFYSQAFDNETIQIAPVTYMGNSCSNPTCHNDSCSGNCDSQITPAVYKTRSIHHRSYKQLYLLKPGTISARDNCDVNYSENYNNFCQSNPFGSTVDSFDIRDNKFVTNFRNGVVHLIYYSNQIDELGNELVPDNYRILEYIEAFIKYKVFEMLSNQTSDETFNQLERKLAMYKAQSDEAYIMAEMEIKKQTLQGKLNSIHSLKNRFNKYQLRNNRQR